MKFLDCEDSAVDAFAIWDADGFGSTQVYTRDLNRKRPWINFKLHGLQVISDFVEACCKNISVNDLAASDDVV